MSGPRAAAAVWPYPHRTQAELERLHGPERMDLTVNVTAPVLKCRVCGVSRNAACKFTRCGFVSGKVA